MLSCPVARLAQTLRVGRSVCTRYRAATHSISSIKHSNKRTERRRRRLKCRAQRNRGVRTSPTAADAAVASKAALITLPRLSSGSFPGRNGEYLRSASSRPNKTGGGGHNFIVYLSLKLSIRGAFALPKFGVSGVNTVMERIWGQQEENKAITRQRKSRTSTRESENKQWGGNALA